MLLVLIPVPSDTLMLHGGYPSTILQGDVPIASILVQHLAPTRISRLARTNMDRALFSKHGRNSIRLSVNNEGSRHDAIPTTKAQRNLFLTSLAPEHVDMRPVVISSDCITGRRAYVDWDDGARLGRR